MRAALPDSVPFSDAVHNVGAAALAVAAISEGRLDLLSAATVDRLHEPYRAAAYPELPELLAAARAAGAMGACLSGAGSTVLAFSQDLAAAATIASAMERRALALRLTGRALVQGVRSEGVRAVAVGAQPRTRPDHPLA
jgi:homoserine kinase